MISKKITIAIVVVVLLLCFFLLSAVAKADLTHYVNINLKQSLAVTSEKIQSQLLKTDMMFEAGWVSHVTDYNRIVLLGILSAILIGGIVSLAIIDRQISRMTAHIKPV